MTAEPLYPEHEKMAKVSDDSQTIGEFLEWAQSSEDTYVIMEMFTEGTLEIEDVLCSYFGIDSKKIEAEKQAMIEALDKPFIPGGE